MKSMEQIWKEPCDKVGAILVVLQGSQKREGGGFAWSGPEDAGAMIDRARVELQKACQPDRFAPRDFLNVIDTDFLPVLGARPSLQIRSETFEAVWTPRMTPSSWAVKRHRCRPLQLTS